MRKTAAIVLVPFMFTGCVGEVASVASLASTIYEHRDMLFFDKEEEKTQMQAKELEHLDIKITRTPESEPRLASQDARDKNYEQRPYDPLDRYYAYPSH